MFQEYIGIDVVNKTLTVYDYHAVELSKFQLGESLINYLNLDLRDLGAFFDDMKPIFEYDYGNRDVHTRTEKINLCKLRSFFNKYPALKLKVITTASDIASSIHNDYKPKDFNPNDYLDYFDHAYTSNDSEVYANKYFIDNGLSDFDTMDPIYRWISIILTNISSLRDITWDFVYDDNCFNPYIKNLKEINNHLYFRLIQDDQCDFEICHQMRPYNTQQAYIDLARFCFEYNFDDNLNSLTALERFYLYTRFDCNYYEDEIKSSFILCRNNYSEPNITSHKDSNDNKVPFIDWVKPQITNDLIDSVKCLKIRSEQLYATYSLENIIGIEFQKMLEANIKIKKCANCGKYFILKGEYRTDYCDNIPEGKKLTCKKIAAINARKNKIKQNPILSEYEKAYKRNYARVANHKMTNEDFRLWVDQASIKRDQTVKEYEATHSDELLANFKKYLCNR